MRDIALISGKIYTAGKNFTRPPVVTVATNLNSVNLWGVIMNLCGVGGDIARNICLVAHAQTVEMWRGGADWSD